jgi:hypothetical protein
MGTGKDKHIIFRDEEVVIPNVRVFGDGRGTVAFNLITEELQGHKPKRSGRKTLFILIIIYYF